MENRKSAAMYLRLSDGDMDTGGTARPESGSISAQRNLITAYISAREEFKDYEVTEFADDGYSGTGFSRPQFVRMMEEAKKGKISVILVKDFSRFGRDYLEVGNYLERIFPLLGIRFISVNDCFDSADCRGMTGGMGVALKNILNAMYSRDLSVKIKTALNTRAADGQCMVSFAAYGYRKDPADRHRLITDPEAAETVRRIFSMAAEGVTKTGICRCLNESHVPTPTEHMRRNGVNKTVFHEKEIKLWTVTTIGDMLKNEVYLGKTIWNKSRRPQAGARKQIKNGRSQWTVVEGTHEPLVSQELFDRANERAFTHIPKKNARCGGPGLLIMCPYCGRRMAHGGHLNYRCMQAGFSGIPECAQSRIRREILENLILKCTKEMAAMLSAAYRQKKTQRAQARMLSGEIQALEDEKTGISARKFRLYEDYRSGACSRENCMQELERMRERLAEIERMVPEMERLAKEAEEQEEAAGRKEESLADITALHNFDKAVLSRVIDRVYVYGPDRVEIVWRADDIFYQEFLPEERKEVNPQETISEKSIQ